MENLDPSKLHPDYTGIRPKYKKRRKNERFFILTQKNHEIEGLINIQGIESPGVTSSLAIAEYVKDIVLN